MAKTYLFKTKQSLGDEGYTQNSGREFTLAGVNVITGILRYFSDDSDNYTLRSIVDKEYVDKKIDEVSGTITDAEGLNIGTGVGIYDSKDANILKFRSLEGVGGTIIERVGNNVTIFSEKNKNILTELPNGVINGINKVFITTTPFVDGTISVYLNGLKEKNIIFPSDTEIEFIDAPKNDGFVDIVEVTYVSKI